MKLYGIIGFPLAQSASPAFFNAKFENDGIDARYLPFEIENIDELPAILESNPELCGFNVTIPYKQKVMQYLAGISDEAKEIDAVNVVKVTHGSDGKPLLQGFNSDVIGFTRSIETLVKGKHKKALILGTGGASKAIAYSLKKLGIDYKFVSRKAGDGKIAYSDLNKDIMREHTLIVNCTPLGMTGHGVDQCPDVPYEYIGSQHLLCDIVYNPENTLFLQKGAERGAATKSGYEMWYLQALASWEIWNR